MPNAFNFDASPFDCLDAGQRRLVRNSVDIAYFREGQVILDVGDAPAHLHVVIKGCVTQHEGDELVGHFGPDDCFDGRGLVAGRVSSRFVAAEEVVAYLLTHEAVNELIAANATFGALLFSDLGHKLTALSQRESEHERQSLTLARVDEAFLRPPNTVAADLDILSVVRLFQARRTASVLVSDASSWPPRLGIFTSNSLQRAILDGRPLGQLAVGEFAHYALVTVQPSDQLGDAMALMLRHRVHRLVVRDGEQVLGVLEALDLFSFLSNHSHLITVQIEQASDLDGLVQAAARITRLVALLYRGGTRVGLIARLVQQLNARLFERTWQMLAPPDLVAHSCLFVMGSEGRGEQLLKTDQDNGLLLRDGYTPPPHLAQICQRFSEALARFGYPECPGHIMLSHPDWCQPAGAMTERARGWLLHPEPDGLMKLAIFMDAHAVAGDATLLAQVRQGVQALSTDNDALLGRFAAAIEAFGASQGWWNRWLSRGSEGERHLHLKKEGLFPLVHGVRSLALARHLGETGTVARIQALVADGTLSEAQGHELIDSLHFFMGLRLQAGLAELDAGHAVSGVVDVGRLSTLERDLLKDTLAVVKRFRALLRQRFRLDAL